VSKAGLSKYNGMDNYVVKVKKLHRPTFSMIIVWLSDGSESPQDLNNIKNQQLTLAWISYGEGMKRKIAFSGGDNKKLTKGLYGNFVSEFSDTINILKHVANLEQVQSMLKIIESFIDECVISKIKNSGDD